MTYPRWYGGAGTGEAFNILDYGASTAAASNNTAIQAATWAGGS